MQATRLTEVRSVVIRFNARRPLVTCLDDRATPCTGAELRGPSCALVARKDDHAEIQLIHVRHAN